MSGTTSEIVVTGAGAVSALGLGCKSLLEGLIRGRDGIRPIGRFPTASFSTHLGAMVPEEVIFNPIPYDLSTYELCFHFARLAATEALHQARLSEGDFDPLREALVFGTSLGDFKSQHHMLPWRLAAFFGLKGPALTISTACSSSTNAIGMALELLKGSADIVLAGGADVLSPEVFAGFHALGVLSPEKCAPFSEPLGTTLGEGAGFLVLEHAETAARRGIQPLAAVSGYGLSADAFHETTPDPSGSGVARAIESALRHAGLSPGEIGYINAHGTGTGNNDSVEWLGIQRVFRNCADSIPVSSSKGHFGHAQGAAGVLEIIATLLLLPRQEIPPTLHYRKPRPRCPADPVAADRPRPHNFHHAACLNSAFGGANAGVIVSKPRISEQKSFSQPLEVLGLGAAARHGLDLKNLEIALRDSSCPGSIPPYEIDRIVPSADPRGMDPATKHLIAASALALLDAGVSVRGSLRERTGLIVGTTRISSRSANEFRNSIIDRGLASCSPAAFARIVLNAPAGACTKVLALRGPTSTVTIGPGSGLAAIIYGALWLSSRGDTDLILAGGVDEADSSSGSLAEGAAFIALAPLGTYPSPSDRQRVCLAGFGMAGKDNLPSAVEHALDMAEVAPMEIERVFGRVGRSHLKRFLGRFPKIATPVEYSRLCGGDDAAASALDCVAACLSLRRGDCRVALVVTEGGPCAACAIILAARRANNGSQN
jgi:3-oxoacyl-[acyl-carrier-protein] synthase II